MEQRDSSVRAAMPARPRLLFVVNVDWFFVSHRLPIALAALKCGYEVHLATELTGPKDALERAGLVVHTVPFGRGSASLPMVIRAFLATWRIIRDVRPQLVHLVTIKPVLMGGLVARLLGVPAKVSAISGLGFVFVSRGIFSVARRIPIRLLYGLALRHPNSCIVFQNDSDREQVLRMARIPKGQVRMIRGSGVDLERYSAQLKRIEGPPIVLMAARLLKDKGVGEFVQAAYILRDSGARFVLAGDIDPGNPTSLSAEDVANLKAEGHVEVWGHQADMATVLTQASIFVLPSYREGLPKVLLEAAACGKPVITTDVPGCRDAILPNATGLLVPVRDSAALAAAIKDLISDPDRSLKMGRAGRQWIEAEHDIRMVVGKHLAIYEDLMKQITES